MKKHTSWFPYVVVTKNNLRVVADKLQQHNVPELFKIGRSAAEDPSSGVSPLDLPSEERFLAMTRSAMLAVQYTLQETKTLIGFTIVYHAELARSCKPICGRGLSVFDKKYHNIGLGRLGIKVTKPLVQDEIPVQTSRSSLTNVLGLLHAKKAGLDLPCWVPDSYQDSDGRWHDDLLNTDISPSKLYHLSDQEALERARAKPAILVYSKIKFKGKDLFKQNVIKTVPLCNIRSTTSREDLEKVHAVLFRYAKEGEGFGLDEFPNIEIFLNHFLKERTVVLLEKHPSELMAVAVVGPSRICRTPDPLSCSIYMLVMSQYRNKGIGTEFVKHLFMYIKQSGYSAVLTDVLVTKVLPYRFLTRLGFNNVGCVPKTAYVAGSGYSDALVFYRKLDDVSMVAKI